MIMAGENAGRPLLPQTAQVQSFTFATPTMAPRENQKSTYFHRSSIVIVPDAESMWQIMSSSTSTTAISG